MDNNSPKLTRSDSTGPFAYQTRLLERTSSRAGSISRNNSTPHKDLLSNLTGSSNGTPTNTRRWTPTHRVGHSLDAIRKWEERAKTETTDEALHIPRSTSPTKMGSDHRSAYTPDTNRARSSWTSRQDDDRPPTPPPKNPLDEDVFRTPTHMKRRTMPSPIVASPLSPNTTGATVESGPGILGRPVQQIHIPSSFTSVLASSSSSGYRPQTTSQVAVPPSPVTPSSISRAGTENAFGLGLKKSSPPARYRRSNTVDTPPPSWQRSPTKDATAAHTTLDTLPPSWQRSPTKDPSAPSSTDTPPPSWQRSATKDIFAAAPSPAPSLSRRPTSLYGSPYASTPPSPIKSYSRPSSSTGFSSATSSKVTNDETPLSSPSVMSPAPYRSSYVAKKASLYGSNLGTGRKLGRHLPRIASGDGDEHWQEEQRATERKDEEDRASRREKRESKMRNWGQDETSSLVHRQLNVEPAPVSATDVVGIPGRRRLAKDAAPSTPTSPLPSARLLRGTWADVERQHIQAYEYLCHVGEAQQWIEGCLGEELGFGVVEMEEGLRNGVVLAKLVRVFQGESAVRRIYEAPKLDFRHSDNINIFFNFVREIGLPECFIFELTDLYEKKNLPKVVYCIHALSHLLARRGMAERIGDLYGHLKFSDDQLQKTQKGLSDAGVPMPNFGNIQRELAKEINEEPEVEVETEEERRDRLLMENEDSIIAAQSLFRGFLARKDQTNLQMRMRLADRYVVKLQAQFRGTLARRARAQHRQSQLQLLPWIISVQARARGVLFRRQWYLKVRRIKASVPHVVKVQAQLRGILLRRRFAKLKAALRKSNVSVTKLQSIARARIAQNAHNEIAKTFAIPLVHRSVVGLQAHARGALARRKVARLYASLKRTEPYVASVQAQCRALLVRRRFHNQLAKLEDVTNVIIRIQAAARTFLAKKRLLALIRGLRRATSTLVGLQARARAKLARQKHINLQKALVHAKTIVAVNSFQARARAALARKRHQELHRELEFYYPEMVGLQAATRGALVRLEYRAWRDHLNSSYPVATILQAMLRGTLFRKKFRAKMEYFRVNLSKVVKIQSLFRAKETREQYRQLTMGTNVTTGTIKNFVHLLDDSEADFQDEIKVERLRKRVVESIRENQVLETDLNDLDVKIALVVDNAKSLEEILKARRRLGGDSAAVHAARTSLLAAHSDPFSGAASLDREAKRKLELYQQLFYLLQTRGDYLSRLFTELSADDISEENRKFTERVVLTLFGYGQDRREDYLLLKVFQHAIRDEVNGASSIEDVVTGHPMYMNIAVHYVRRKQVIYVRDTLQGVIREVIDTEDLDLEADPSLIHRTRIDVEELKSGVPSGVRKNLPFHEALNDPATRAEYIRHLQVLQWWTEAFVTALTASIKKMPYSMRYLARETLSAVRERFPGASEESYAACVARLIYYRYINPAIITPETFEIVGKTIDIGSRKNLAQISKILTQITHGREFTEDTPSYIPINDYVTKAIGQMTSWLLEVANVADAESTFHAHEFLDVTAQPKPIYISPNEIYTIHGLLSQHLAHLAPSSDDTLRVIISELDGVPHLNDELKDARDQAITLELTNRFAHVEDSEAKEKALWVQAKRGVLAILRVQPAQELVEALMRPVNEVDEQRWEEVLDHEMENEQVRTIDRRMPSTSGADGTYRLEDIRSLKFAAVKALTISFLLDLETLGKITRNDGFQGILNAIAVDVRSKHRKRLQRQQEMENMNQALTDLSERKRNYEEQINSYHSYVESAISTMSKGKAKSGWVVPFTKQWSHLRNLQRSGQAPQFGSYLYTAKDLYEKAILLSVDQYSPRQFDKIHLIISSNTPGVFNLLLESTIHGITSRLAGEDVRLEDLLQARFDNRSSYSLFNGIVKVNLNQFLYQLNKKFYRSSFIFG
ncbi:hypothetical protein EYR36_005982 [Pleurotus pulmonarius]|nr:hypothetical protein EYR36_005982 [Pleurotus pulmonarius]KAF4600690.1 hypothetical protein EYR38_005333 [Pleurotus pulmonarius]